MVVDPSDGLEPIEVADGEAGVLLPRFRRHRARPRLLAQARQRGDAGVEIALDVAADAGRDEAGTVLDDFRFVQVERAPEDEDADECGKPDNDGHRAADGPALLAAAEHGVGDDCSARR